MLFDSHAHISDEKFDNDRDEVINRAKENGIKFIMNPGVELESSKKAIDLSEKYEMIYAAVGFHPHEVKNMDDTMLSLIESLAKKAKVKAIGEIGLDYYYDHSPRKVQKEWFIKQIRLAKKIKLPIIIHDRDANLDTMTILKNEDAFENGVLLHCFSGSVELAKEYIQLGAYISLAGPVTFKNAVKPKEVAKIVPLDKILIETDSPYLSPEPKRGKRNESSYVEYVCNQIAILKEVSFDVVANATYENAKRFFKID
ncbi:MAG: TatD family hydrolase [Bacillota bacterium]|nr:TatD family hydrolase [Bacillota bacterium]